MDKKIEEFKAYLYENELSDNTVEAYTQSVKEYYKAFNELNQINAINWKRELMKDHKPKTVNLRITGLQKYCEFMNIEISIKQCRLQQENSIENVINIDQYKKLIKGLKEDNNQKWLNYILIASMTGARISELLRLTKKDLDNGYSDMFTKGKTRRIYIPSSLKEAIGDCYKNADDDQLLITNRYGKKMSSRGFSVMLKKLADKYDIPKEVMHPHSFRHFFAMEFLKRNNDMALLADILGHGSMNTTMIYLRKSKQQQIDEVNKTVQW